MAESPNLKRKVHEAINPLTWGRLHAAERKKRPFLGRDSMTITYILKGIQVVPFHGSLREWHAWKDINNTLVKQTQVHDIWICTRFGGLVFQDDENKGGPLVFSTGIFDMKSHPYRYPRDFGRYATWDEAEAGHRAAIDIVQRDLCQVQFA